MTHTFKRLYFLPAIVAGATLTGCSLDPYEISDEESYTREFVREFGVFDNAQDWTYAARKAVTVAVPGTSEVKVYASVDGQRYIFADYKGVSGTQTLKFDLPKAVDDIIVRVGTDERRAKVGATVDFTKAATRTITEHSNEGSIGLTVTAGDWMEMAPEMVVKYRDHLPEGKNNVGKYTQNFHFEHQGDLTIYPVYYQTSNSDRIGIYTQDADGTIHRYQVSQPQLGQEMAYATESAKHYAHQEAWFAINPTGNWVKNKNLSTNFSNYTESDIAALRAAILADKDLAEWQFKFASKTITSIEEVQLSGKWTDVQGDTCKFIVDENGNAQTKESVGSS